MILKLSPKLIRKITVLLYLQVATLIGSTLPAEEAQSRNQEAIIDDDVLIYKAVLEHTLPHITGRQAKTKDHFEKIDGVWKNQPRTFLLGDRSVTYSDVDSYCNQYLERKEFNKLTSDLKDSLRSRNTASTKLPVFTAKEPINFVSSNELKGLDNEFNRKSFSERFPDPRGTGNLSLPGYSNDASKALVYFSFGCGRLCGAWSLFMLHKENDHWSVDDEYVCAVS